MQSTKINADRNRIIVWILCESCVQSSYHAKWADFDGENDYFIKLMEGKKYHTLFLHFIASLEFK